MINDYHVKEYCCEDPSLIENYEEAMADSETWVCHHRKGIELKKSIEELKAMGLYYNRPACELIFLKNEYHSHLHSSGENNPMYGVSLPGHYGEKNGMYGKGYLITGEKNGMYNKHHTQEARDKISKATKGKNNPMYGKNAEDYMTEEAIREKRRKYSESMKGVNKNRKWMNNGSTNVFVKESDTEKYLQDGWTFGMVRHNKIKV